MEKQEEGKKGLLGNVDREALPRSMGEALPGLREELGVSVNALSRKSGVSAARISGAERGVAPLKWGEYLSILSLFWESEKGRRAVEGLGLFPKELKEAFSVNRNAHAPTEM